AAARTLVDAGSRPIASAAAERAPSVEAAPLAGVLPGATAPAGERPPAVPEVPADGDRWQAFLASAQSKVSLRMCLNGSRPLAHGSDLVHIAVESEFAERALTQRENLALLTELAARCWGGAPRIEVSVARAPNEDAAAERAAQAARARDLDARARSS